MIDYEYLHKRKLTKGIKNTLYKAAVPLAKAVFDATVIFLVASHWSSRMGIPVLAAVSPNLANGPKNNAGTTPR